MYFLKLSEIAVLTKPEDWSLYLWYMSIDRKYVQSRSNRNDLPQPERLVRRGRKNAERVWNISQFDLSADDLMKFFRISGSGFRYGFLPSEVSFISGMTKNKVTSLKLEKYQALRFNRDKPEKLVSLGDKIVISADDMIKLFTLAEQE